MSDILDTSARETLARFAAKTLSPVEYMQALIARVDASEPKVGALCL